MEYAFSKQAFDQLMERGISIQQVELAFTIPQQT
jgi:hypothetical protein